MKSNFNPLFAGSKMLVFLLVISFGFGGKLAAQNVADSRGTNFWICFPGNQGSPAPQLYITGVQASTVTISIDGLGYTQTVSVPAGGLQVVNLPTGAQVQSQFVAENKGIHITATKEITVYGMNAQNATTDAFLAFPVDVLGTEYYVLGYDRDFSFSIPTQATFVATQNNTSLTITSTETGGGFTAGTPNTITLQQGEVYQMRSLNANADYTGTKVVSNKPVSVFGGAQCTNISGNLRACDHLVEQLPPTSTWGQSFVTVPLATRLAGDVFRFLAQKNNTVVKVNGTTVATLDAGEMHETILSSTSYNLITANEGILVGQYSRSSQADGVTSDPFFALVPPDEQFLNSYVISAGTSNIPGNYLNITSLTSNKGTVQVDGAAVAAGLWQVIPGTSYSGAKVPVSAGVHTVTSTRPIGLLVYGFGSFDSYGYLGGQLFGKVEEVFTLSLTPASGTAALGTRQCFEALIEDQDGNGLSNIRVDFTITGPHDDSSGFAFTDANGIATFCYTGTSAGTDNIVASATGLTDNATFIWTSVPNIYYSKSVGDLHNTATWGLNPDGSGAAPSDFGAGKTFMLANRSVNYNLTAAWTVGGTLNIPTASQLNIGSHALSLALVTGPGSFSGTTASKLAITSGPNTLRFVASANSLATLTINGSGAAATLASQLGVYEVLTISGSGQLAPGNFLTLKSTATTTARVAPVAGTISSGNITVERYIPARRAWRLLDAPVGGSQSIKAAWQEGASNVSSNPAPGYGTHITGGTAANGFDQNTYPYKSTVSLKMYNQATGKWVGVPNTTSTAVGGKALMLFVRGNRAIPLAGPDVPPNNTTLRASGPLKVGTQNFSIAATGFTALPNPYASPVDFQTLSKTVIQDNFYVWDPKLGGTYGVGAFVNVSWNGTAYEMMPAPASPISKIIQSGQAFLVRSKGSAGSLSIAEANKSATAATNVFRTAEDSDASANMSAASQKAQGLKLSLQVAEADGSAALLDGIHLSYSPNYADEIDDMDVAKLDNLEENLAIARGTHSLLVDRRRMAVANDTVSLRLWNTAAAKKYILEVSPVNMAESGLFVYLKDHYLHTTSKVDLSAGSKVNFSISDDPASARADRFSMLVTTKELQAEGSLEGITVLQNPVRDGVVRIRMLNQPQGIYGVQLVNSLGQTLYRGQINHSGGSAVQTVPLQRRLAQGVYLLQVVKGGAKTALKVIGE